MSISYEQVLSDVLGLLDELSNDWEYEGTVTPDTGLLTDMGFESLELVVLGVSIQEQYKLTIPFPEFLAELGERKADDIFVKDLVRFIHHHVGDAVAGGLR